MTANDAPMGSVREKAYEAGIGSGAYSLREAALLIQIPYAKLRRWVAGYWYSSSDQERFSTPVVPGQLDELDERILSFHELMELFVIGFFRREGVSMLTIRLARTRAQALYHHEYPFAVESMNTDGRGIFGDHLLVDGSTNTQARVELSRGQLAFEVLIEPFFRDRVEYSAGLASSYWPLGKNRPIVLDAQRAFGQPIIKRTGTPTYVLYAMSTSGEIPDRITSWYGVSSDELSAAIEYESALRKAA